MATKSSGSSSPIISTSSYNRIVREAAAKGISASRVAATANAAGISVGGSTSSGRVSSSGIKAATEAAGQGVTYNPDTGKYTKPTVSTTIEPIQIQQQTVNNQGVTGESPGPSSGDATGAVASGGGQESGATTQGQHQQGVVSGSQQTQSSGGGQTKQQVLDQAVRSGQATVDAQQNVISSSGRNLGNLAEINLEDNAIGPISPAASIPVQEQNNIAKQEEQREQQKINNIKPEIDLGLNNSPDSPYWNNFGNVAIEMENKLPGYMNERNKVIASSMMLNNTSIRFMSEGDRKDAILKEIIDRQEGGIDPEMEGRYKNTINNINNLINRDMPSYSANDFFGMLVNGEKIDYIAAAGNPALKSARNRFNDMNKYSTMDASGLSAAIESGELNKGSQLWNDLINKGMGEVLNKAYGMYNTKTESSVYNYVSNELNGFNPNLSLEGQASPKIELGTGLEMQISEKILSLMTSDKLPTLASFIAADEDIQRAKTQSRETEAQINDLSDQITEFSDDVKTKVVERGGEATGDPFLDAYIQEKTKPFVKRLTQLQGKYRNEIAVLSDLTENARTEFEVKEYNKQSEIQGYQFLLSRIDKQNAEKLAAKQAAQQQSNRERKFEQDQRNFEANYKLDQAKFNLSLSNARKVVQSSPDILNRLWSGTAGIKDLLSDKQLAISGMTGMEKTQAIQSAGAGMMYTKSKDNPTQAMKRRSEVLKSSSAYNTENFVKPATAIYGANKTYSYLLDNDIKNIQNDPKISREESYDQIAEMLSLTFGDAEVDRMLLFAGLKDRLGSSQHANEILDRLDMETYGWLDSRRINVQK